VKPAVRGSLEMQDAKMTKNRHLRTIAQLCRAISSQRRHISTIGKKLVKQQYLLQMSLQYGELLPTSGWDLLAGLGHPIIFQRYRFLAALLHGSQVVGVSQTLRRWTEAGRPSRWTLVHILVVYYWADLQSVHRFCCY